MRRVVAAAAASVLVLVACGGEEEQPPTQPPNTIVLDGQVANDHGSTSVDVGEDRVVIAAGDFYFQPTVLTGEAGQEVVLAVTSASETVHNVTISKGALDEDVPPGETVELDLAFPESGSAVFVCKYHRTRGMAGALVAL
jgi:plastocyanin